MSETEATVSLSADDAGLRAAMAEAKDAAADLEAVAGELVLQAPQSVDAGWASRKFLAGSLGGLVIFVVLTYAFLASGAGVDVLLRPAEHAGWFPAMWYVIAIGLDLLFVLICYGFIQSDKVFDLIREALPILKAKYGVGPKA